MSFEHSVYLTDLARTCSVAATRYIEKIKLINVDPYTLADSSFDFGLDAVPPVSNMDIVSYLVLTHSYYTKEQMKAYKSLTAYKYFQAGFVEKVGVKEINNYMLLVAKVQHSMRAREPKLKVWIIMEKDGGICTAHCTCMAGLGEVCSHVAAVLYAAEYAANVKMSISCTDIKSTWPVPSQSGLQPTPAASMDWGKIIDSKINIDVPPIQNNELCCMLQDIETSNQAAALMRIVEPFASNMEKDNTIVPLFFNIYDKKLERCDLATLISLGKNIDTTITLEIIHKIDEKTQGQRKSEEWYRHRTGRITASIFKNVCCTSVDKPSISLIKNICYPVKNKVFSKAISWGIEHEDNAVDSYHKNMETKHENLLVNKVGLIVSQFWPQLGATPDRMVYCDCCKGGCLEVKCPYNLRSCGIVEYAKLKDSCLTVDENNKVHLNTNHAYYYQSMAQIFVCNLLYCDFVVWSPNVFFRERIYPDFNFWEDIMLPKALTFHSNVILPELLGRYYTSKIPGGNITSWCLCGGTDDNTPMIKCENKDCNIIYFHCSCVSVSENATSWVCGQCNINLNHCY